MRVLTRTALLLGVVVAVAAGFGCKKEDQTAQPNAMYPQNQYPQGQYPQQQGQYPQQQGQYPQQQMPQQYPQGQATAQPPATQAPPAGGFPCQTDNDPQCVFGKCVAGKCGSCASAADCKPGAQCTPTPLGMACMPGLGAAPAPTQ